MSKKNNWFKSNFDSRYVCTAIAFIVFISATLLIVFTGVAMSNAGDYVEADKKEKPTSVISPTENVDKNKENENFDVLQVSDTQLNEGELVVVNKEHQCLTNGLDLIGIMDNKNDTYTVADYLESLNSVSLKNLNDMMSGFYAYAGPTDIFVSCGYRSYETQKGIYDNSVAVNGSEHADVFVSKPGYSEHQTGYVFDFALYDSQGNFTDFTGEGNYSWISQNCKNYGYILRYTQEKEEVTGINYEPWHFRYVGQGHSQYITDNGLALEEYIDLLKNKHTKENPLKLTDVNGVMYYTYYEAKTDGNNVYVPKNKEYTISGDNIEGYIITYKE